MAKKTHAKIPAKCAAKLVKSSSATYRKACTNPQPMPTSGDTPYTNQVHHIVCENAILDIKPAGDTKGEKTEYIMDCLCATQWDINDADNLIALPMKSAYRISAGKTPSKSFCCHNVDHGGNRGYTKECKDWLHAMVWDTLVDKRKGHEWNTTVILQSLHDCTDYFKGELQTRALRPGGQGTEHAYRNRFTLKNWHYAFSMAKFPMKRQPPGNRLSKFIARIR